MNEFENTENLNVENQTQDVIVEEQQTIEPSEGENPQQEQPENTDKEEYYGSPEKFDYTEVQLPEGMELDTDILSEFEPIAKKLNLSNRSANALVALAVKLTQNNVAKFSEYAAQLQEAEKDSYLQLLNTDKELQFGDPQQYDQYINVAIKGVNAVATDGLKQILKDKGLTHHPEFIKTFHKIGLLCQNDSIPDATFSVNTTTERPADILYTPKE